MILKDIIENMHESQKIRIIAEFYSMKWQIEKSVGYFDDLEGDDRLFLFNRNVKIMGIRPGEDILTITLN